MKDDPTSPDSPVWHGLRLHVAQRLAGAVAHFLATGSLCRADVMRIGRVTANQVTADLKQIEARIPGLMVYDTRRRRYVRPTAVLPPREPKADPPAPDWHAVAAGSADMAATFRTARVMCRMTQAQWAKEFDLDRSQINRYETGKAAIPLMAARLAEAYASGFRPAAWGSPADAGAEAERAS